MRRPWTMTRVPLVSDSATFSAASRQLEQGMNRVSPSFHLPVWRSKVRGVEATVKEATAAPEDVKRISGSAVRFPTMVMMVSPAMIVGSFLGVVSHLEVVFEDELHLSEERQLDGLEGHWCFLY